jgi:hypothetical protein
MVDGENVNFVCSNEPVDDSVRPNDYFPHIRPRIFWYFSAVLREVCDPLAGIDETMHHDLSDVWRVGADIVVDRLEIAARAEGPADQSHERNCFLTSSCGTSSPDSD